MGAQLKTPHIADRYDTLTRELILTANNAAKRELSECGDYYRRWQYIIEHLRERYVDVSASEVGALTDAPLLVGVNAIDYPDDNSARVILPGFNLYYFANYALIDETEELRTKGVARFNMVRTT